MTNDGALPNAVASARQWRTVFDVLYLSSRGLKNFGLACNPFHRSTTMRFFRNAVLAAFIASLAVGSAQPAGATTTYVWITTSKAVPYPWMTLNAYYTLEDGASFPTVSSDSQPYDFGGLTDLYVFGGYGYQFPMTLSDLTAPCDDGTCPVPSFPVWYISENNWFYINGYDIYEYIYDGTSFTALSDGGCQNDVGGHRECVWYGYFSNAAPEPATYSLMVLAVPLLAARKGRRIALPNGHAA